MSLIQDRLRESESVAYTCLRNALKEQKVAHSYLFSGEYNPLKIEAAYLLGKDESLKRIRIGIAKLTDGNAVLSRV